MNKTITTAVVSLAVGASAVFGLQVGAGETITVDIPKIGQEKNTLQVTIETPVSKVEHFTLNNLDTEIAFATRQITFWQDKKSELEAKKAKAQVEVDKVEIPVEENNE